MAAAADAEIVGAIAKLRAAFESHPQVNITLTIAVDVVPVSSFAILDTQSEWDTLNSTYPTSPVHDAMNIFIVSRMDFVPVGAIGIAARIPGPFNRQGTIQSGTLAEYQGDGAGTTLGQILAHEFGHFLGLFHTSQTNGAVTAIVGEDPIGDTDVCKTSQVAGSIDNCPDRANLMFPFVNNNIDPPITTGQGNVVKFNPGITVP